MANHSPSTPVISSVLASKGKNTIGHETNLARSPLWHTRPATHQDASVVPPVLYGRPFRQVEGNALTTGDQRLFAHFTTAYVRSGCPQDRHVQFSLGDAAETVGHHVLGGKQRALIRASLARLRSITMESAVRHPDGHETVLGWGLIDTYLIATRGGGKGWVILSEPIARLLQEGSVTFLHTPTWNAICAEDAIAGRLWVFLESEHIGRGWRYSILDAPDGSRDSTALPPIADMLLLHWTRQRNIVERIRQACTVIETHDPRYRLNVAPSKRPGGWILACTRTQSTPTSRTQHGIPGSIITAWRIAYRSQLPSARQRAILSELLDRHAPEWIAATLSDTASMTTDPFATLLQRDRDISARRLREADEREAQWEIEKSRQSAEAEQSIANLIAEVRGRAIRTS